MRRVRLLAGTEPRRGFPDKQPNTLQPAAKSNRVPTSRASFFGWEFETGSA
jgi:hypothetical protein